MSVCEGHLSYWIGDPPYFSLSHLSLSRHVHNGPISNKVTFICIRVRTSASLFLEFVVQPIPIVVKSESRGELITVRNDVVVFKSQVGLQSQPKKVCFRNEKNKNNSLQDFKWSRVTSSVGVCRSYVPPARRQSGLRGEFWFWRDSTENTWKEG